MALKVLKYTHDFKKSNSKRVELNDNPIDLEALKSNGGSKKHKILEDLNEDRLPKKPYLSTERK